MSEKAIRIALVILENQNGGFALQLRSPIASIANPDRWGFFGGHVEEHESPQEGAIREIEEELCAFLKAEKLTFLNSFNMDVNKQYSVFHYLVSDELDHAVLMEGEAFAYFSKEDIERGEKAGKEIVTYHQGLILDFLKNKIVD